MKNVVIISYPVKWVALASGGIASTAGFKESPGKGMPEFQLR